MYRRFGDSILEYPVCELMWGVPTVNTMNIKTQFAEGFSERSAAQQIDVVATIQELASTKMFDTISPVISTNPNGYLGIVFYKDGKSQCVLLGKKSSKKVTIGQRPEKNWEIVKTVSPETGVERFAVSIAAKAFGAEEFE
jgi:hypothetical protein